MASTLKIDTITTPDGTGNITFSRPIVGNLTAQKNLIINGDFNIWQRGTSFPAFPDGNYHADRWHTSETGTAVCTISRSTDVPTVAESGHLSNYSILFDVTTIDSSITGSDLYWMDQRIEGYNFQSIAQKEFTLSFWHKHTKTGTYCVSFRNTAQDRSYIAEYTQTTTDTWEKAEITVSASPSAGTWNYTNGNGMFVSFFLMAGPDKQTTADTWQTGNYYATSNQVNATDSTSNNCRFAQVQLEAGSVATDFEIRNHATELAMCKRYFERINADSIADNFLAVGMSTSTTTGITMLECEVEKRATPTVSHSASGDFDLLASAGNTKPVTALTYSIISKRTIRANGTVASGLIAGDGTLLQADGGGTGYIDISAEL
jgi:hypothetical protein